MSVLGFLGGLCGRAAALGWSGTELAFDPRRNNFTTLKERINEEEVCVRQLSRACSTNGLSKEARFNIVCG